MKSYPKTIPAKEMTYARIYRRAFKGPPLLGYLTVRGYVEPKGMKQGLSRVRPSNPPNGHNKEWEF